MSTIRFTLGVVAVCMHFGIAVHAETFYVCVNGDDAWSGRLKSPNITRTDGPFASLHGARDAIRRLKSRRGLKRPVQVLVRGGVHAIASPFVLEAHDSGTAERPVTYAAYPGERPIISGGRRITGWRKGDGRLWTAAIPDVRDGKWYFHQLFVNGKRRTRARTPNEGYLRTDGPIEPLGDRKKARRDKTKKMGFRYEPGDLMPWRNLDDVNLFVYHSWTASLHWIASLDEDNHIVRFTAPSNWPIGYWERKQRYTVENYPEALDSPGEWYLDRRTGVLHYWPTAEDDMERAEVFAPVLSTLIVARGEPDLGLHVEYVTLRGLSFQHADWRFDKHKKVDGQGAAFQRDAAIMLRGTRACTFDRCEIAHVGTYALWLNRGCQENRVVQCHIHDLGTGGIRIGEMRTPRSRRQAATGNAVDNCFIHDGGHVFPAGHGVWIGRASHNTIRHCEVCDFRYSGFGIGWSWGYAPSTANHNTVEFCHIHNLGKGVLSDMGGIYTLGVSPGTRLANNVMHDVYSYSYGGWGLYNDEGSTHIVMENNVVYNTKSGGYHQHYGRENVLRNNVFAFSKEGQIIRSREEEHVSFIFERNIVLVDNGEPLGGRWNNDNFKIDGNLYWDTSGEGIEFRDRLFEEWQAKGHDQNSVVADPLFVNPRRYDFRLKPESPAHKLEFKDIDTSKVGLYGPTEWTCLPKHIKRPPVSYLTKPKLTSINDDFETTPVGDPPANCRVSGGGEGGVLRVTDETAAVGKRSLKFVDASGLAHEWQPHVYYRMKFKRGRAVSSLYLRAEPGARMYLEWRDYRGKYKVGPNFAITPDGQFTSNGKPLLQFPHGKWFRVSISCMLGVKNTGSFDMTVTLPGEPPRHFEALPFRHPEFRRLTWLGFSSTATDRQTFYVDDLRLQVEKRR